MRPWLYIPPLLLMSWMLSALDAREGRVGSPEGRVVLSGTVKALSCYPHGQWCRARLEPAAVDAQPIEAGVWVGGPKPLWSNVREGQVVAGQAHVNMRLGPRNPGKPEHLISRSPYWTATWLSEQLGVASPESVERQASTSLFGVRLAGTPAGVLWSAVLIGDRQHLTEEMRQAFVDTGTAHLLAISGLHMAVMGWGFYRVLLFFFVLFGRRLWGYPLHRPAAIGALGGIWAYVGLIQPSDSSLRAAIMLSLFFAAHALGRGWLAWRAVGLAALALALSDPTSLVRPSFQLSFTAVASILLVLPLNRRLLLWIREPGRLSSSTGVVVASWLMTALLISLATSLGTAPLTLAWFGTWSASGLLINAIAVPWLTMLVIPSGILISVLMTVDPEVGSAAWLGFAWAPELLLYVIKASSEAYGSSQGDAIHGILGLIGAIGVVFCALKGHVRGALFVIITVLVLGYLPLSRGSLRMTMLDVGHGDAATLRFPEGGKMLVDTGGGRHDASNRAVAYRQITPALARQQMTDLDVLVITHSDLDHVGAAGRLLDRIRVDELWLAPCGHDVRALKSLIAQAIGSETRVRLLHAGESFHWQGVTVSPLWPPVHHRLADGSCLHGANGSSLVLHLGYAGRSIVLAADIGMAQERAIMRHFPGLSADVLKVAHHGSKSSTSSSWIESLSPRFALISGPFKGGRMPPHASTAERLIRQGVWTFITGRDGAIDVEISETGRLDVRPHLSRLTERLRPP